MFNCENNKRNIPHQGSLVSFLPLPPRGAKVLRNIPHQGSLVSFLPLPPRGAKILRNISNKGSLVSFLPMPPRGAKVLRNIPHQGSLVSFLPLPPRDAKVLRNIPHQGSLVSFLPLPPRGAKILRNIPHQGSLVGFLPLPPRGAKLANALNSCRDGPPWKGRSRFESRVGEVGVVFHYPTTKIHNMERKRFHGLTNSASIWLFYEDTHKHIVSPPRLFSTETSSRQRSHASSQPHPKKE
uniref:Uncharacterized protein n=1 Tax=Timema cristinae TaxID=61476 RepID=A0A7R9CV40_TIMCR|nr:unnamed protein product [Timema cristinae]